MMLKKAIGLVVIICSLESAHPKPWIDLDQVLENDDIGLLDGILLDDSPTKDPRPFYIECATSSECMKGHCCAIGRQRFALPWCAMNGDVGDPCIPGATAVERNHTYPDNAQVRLAAVYDMFCPCGFGLHCDPSTRTCAYDGYYRDMNLLDE